MRVVVVEDEPAIREVEIAYLQAAGFAVSAFSDGVSALRELPEMPADFYVVDINLPGMDGLEVCRRLRQHSLAPIILVTARSRDLDELTGLQAGADDYLRKPFNPDILVARVNALLRRHGERTLVAAGLVLDPLRQTVRQGEGETMLTAIQFKILYLLASSPGRVFTRGEIVDKAWGDPFDCAVLERTVDAHIKRIRRLVGEADVIRTVVGKGYSFHA